MFETALDGIEQTKKGKQDETHYARVSGSAVRNSRMG
jgi:hypothetical protein